MRKILAAVMALSMLACVTSCSKTADSSSDTQETTAAETTAEETTAADSADEGTTAETEPAISPDDLKFDFTGLASEKYIKLLASDKYVLKYSIPQYKMTTELYIDGDNCKATAGMSGVVYSMISKDGQVFMVSDSLQAYAKSTDQSVDETKSQFADMGLVQSGETEVEGKTYKYDEYAKKDDTSSTLKLLVDEKGDLFAFESSGTYLYIDEIGEDFNSDDTFKIPDNYVEMDQEELYTQMSTAMMGAQSGDSGASDDAAAQDSTAETAADSAAQ